MKSILIVEDNLLNLNLMETILDANGYNWYSAENGKLGVELAKEKIPDLVLMDLHMPIMDGYSALECLREEESTRTIPVIAVTGNATSHDRQKIIAHGFNDYVVKPYTIEDLLAAIARFVN